MPSSTMTNYASTQIMDYVLKGTSLTRPTNFYLALFTTSPALDGTGGSEVSTSGTGYARVLIDSATGWSAASGVNQTYTNTGDLTFGIPTANWGTIVAAGLFDATTAGNLWFISNLAVPRAINNGDGSPKIAIGQFYISRSLC